MSISTPPPETTWEDPRETIIYGVLMADGKLAPRSFDSWEQAKAWAQADERPVAWNTVCDCDM